MSGNDDSHANLRVALRSIVAEHKAASKIETRHDGLGTSRTASPRLACTSSGSSLFDRLPLDSRHTFAASSGSQPCSARRSASSPRLTAPTDVQRGRVTPRGSSSQTGRSGSWASSTRCGSTSIYIPDSGQSEFNADKWGVQKPSGRVAGRRPVYAAVNNKPVPLRGGGAGSRPVSRAGSCPASPRKEELDEPRRSPRVEPSLMHSSTPQLTSPRPEQRRPTVFSVATPTSSMARSPRSCFGESHVSLGDDASATAILHQHLQETRERLAAVEAEQRRIVDTSLGALVKVACATQSLPRNCPPCSWPQETVRGDVQFPGSASTSSGLTPRALSPPCSVCSSMSSRARLEDENRWLRNAVERTRLKNGERDIRREAIEARNRQLEEGNDRAMRAMQSHDEEDGCSLESSVPKHAVNNIAEHIREMQASRDAAEARCSALIAENNRLQAFAEDPSAAPAVGLQHSGADQAAQAPPSRSAESKADPESRQQAQEALRNLLETKVAVEQRLGNLIERRQGLKVKLECAS